MEKYKLIENSTFNYLSVDCEAAENDINSSGENGYSKNNQNSFIKEYTGVEIDFFESECKIIQKLYELTFPDSSVKTILDLGCGDGFQSAYFHRKKWEITCSDYSEIGIKKHNPQLIDKLIKGGAMETVNNLIERNERYSIILFKNVLEHSIDPIETIRQLKKLMDKNSLLYIDVPNDYSSFQSYLILNGYSENTLLYPTHHRHYFQFDSLKKLLEAQGLEVVSQQAGFAIEQFLLNSHSNYIKNKLVANEAYLAGCRVSSFLAKEGIEKYIQLRESYAKLGFGRNIITTVKLKI